MDKQTSEKILASCTQFLTGHRRLTPRQSLIELAETLDPQARPDFYGAGEIITGFEQEIAALLGKEAAVFMPSGTMCQQIALRIWSDSRRSNHVAFHPKCHLEIHEQKGYQMLHGLHAVLVGHPDQLMTLEDLRKVQDPLAALLIELPQREIGGQLPTWENLQEMTGWAREHGIPLHLDGARLWECRPYYQREYREIAGLFDSVYVSFYKGLGGLAGAVLAGDASLIGAARIWQRRYGGNLIRLFPYVVSARQGLEQRLPQMQAYHDKACQISELLSAFPGVHILPDPPQTNMMHVYLQGERSRLEQAVLAVAGQYKTLLIPALAPTPLPTWQRFELTVGDATLDLSRDRIAELFQAFFAQLQ